MLVAQIEQFKEELKTLRTLRKTVDETREALWKAAAAEMELRKQLMDVTSVEVGKDYQLHWHRKEGSDG